MYSWWMLLSISWFIVFNTSLAKGQGLGSDDCSGNYEIRCGNKCGVSCACGNETSGKTYFGATWCCIPTDDTCTVTGSGLGSVVSCPNGSRQELSKPCNGKCNFWPNHKHRNTDRAYPRSHMLCASKSQCVKEQEMCNGVGLCEDQSDVQTCSEKTWTDISCPASVDTHRRCNGYLPGQCISTEKFGDGKYNCIDRSDESPYEAKQESVLNITALEICPKRGKAVGLTCGGRCVAWPLWCNDKGPADTCPEINNLTTNNKELCSNTTFWKTKGCSSWGGGGVRCTGWKSGQCKFPYSQQTHLISRNCSDKSDQMHKINGICQDLIVIQTRSEDRCSYVCARHGNFYIENHCKECLTSDPDNCWDSCATPGPLCNSCTNPSYIPCPKSGQCVHPDLRCDLHPQCLYGEDEMNCTETYKEKGLVPRHATFPCQSPHYHKEDHVTTKEIIDKTNVTVKLKSSDTEFMVSNVVNILSVRCNQINECHGNIDEEGCDNDISLIKILLALIGLSTASFMLSTCLGCCLKKSGQESIALDRRDSTEISFLDQLLQANVTSEEDQNKIRTILELKHSQNDSFEEVNIALNSIKNMAATHDFKKKWNSLFYNLELKIHQGNKINTLLCLKRHISHNIAKTILEDAEPDSQVALIRWFRTKSVDAKDVKDSFIQNGIGKRQLSVPNQQMKMVKLLDIPTKYSSRSWNFITLSIKIFFLYLDMVKDIALIISLIGIVTLDSVTGYPTAFSCQVIWLLLSSVFVPLIVFGFQIAKRCPYRILGFETQKYYQENPMSFAKLLLLRIVIVLFSFLIPALLIYIEENAKENAKQLMIVGKNDKETMAKAFEIKQFADDVGQVILDFKKNEFSVEITIQLTVQILMLLMNYSKTTTTSGLEAIFEVDDKYKLQSKPTGIIKGWPASWDYEIRKSIGTKTILVLSILWSFKTTMTTYIKIKSMEKQEFFAMKAKIVLSVRTFICTVTRVGCIIIFFTPFLGLFDIHAHWKSEQINFEPPKGINMSNDSFPCWKNDMVHYIPYAQLYRSDYHNGTSPPTPPSYSLYTIIKLDMAYLIFWIIMLFQALALLCSKSFLNDKFNSWTKTSRIRHIVQTLHVPDIVSDWDEMDGDVEDHRRRWRKTILEITILILIQFLVHICLLLPIFITGLKIRERHGVISPCIGVFAEEIEAFNLVTALMWSLPVAVCLATAMDWILYFIYQNKFHPWVGIIQDDSDDVGDKILETTKLRLVQVEDTVVDPAVLCGNIIVELINQMDLMEKE